MELTDSQLAVLRSIFDAAPAAPAASPVAVPAAAPAAAASAPAPLASQRLAVVRDIVSQKTVAGTRWGIVTEIGEPAVTGIDNSDPEHPVEITAVHADVVWFGLDGLTTVPLDALTPIG
jgi:hypothetical protein